MIDFINTLLIFCTAFICGVGATIGFRSLRDDLNRTTRNKPFKNGEAKDDEHRR